jgi:hypothetical protein
MTDRYMADRTTAQQITLLFGIVFLAVGILGFIPGITTNYDDLSFAGTDSDAELLGVFQVSVLHNIVHALFGIAGLALARTYDGARTYLLGSGVIYAVLFIYGLFVGGDDDANFIPMNGADDVLHLVLAVALLGAWAVTARERAPRTSAA